MTLADDRVLLAATLQRVMERFSKDRGATLLSPARDEDLKEIADAIEQCTAFRSAAGKMVHSGNQGVPIEPRQLAAEAFSRVRYSNEASAGLEDRVAESADWLLRVLSTEKADVYFIAAIWGLEVTTEIQLLDTGARLLPFSDLPRSVMKSQIESIGNRQPDWFVWYSQQHWRPPSAVYIQTLHGLPYLTDSNAPTFQKLETHRADARKWWTLFEVAVAGHPLAFGSWFEFVDKDLDLARSRNFITWSTPEVTPKIIRNVAVDPNEVAPLVSSFASLSPDFQSDLLRSADRFILSQCREQRGDMVLDRALAFEIAVRGKGSDQGLSPTWKVSTRTAQLIGGPLEQRQQLRSVVAGFYRLRNEATHGGRLQSMKEKQLIDEAAQIYLRLFKIMLNLKERPDWSALELEPRQTQS